MPGSVTAMSRTTNGTTDWSVPAEARGLPITFRCIAQGSGAVAGSVAVHQGSVLAGTAYYDTTAATTLAPSGTNLATVSQTFEATGNQEWRFILTGISASTTVSVVASW